MPGPGRNYQFGDALYYLIQQMIGESIRGFSVAGKLNLGAGPGDDGGDAGPPAPIVGQLHQRKVAYDTTERLTPELFGTTRSGWTNSLLDNLNHIRYWQRAARWFDLTFNNTYTIAVNSGIWWRGAGSYINFNGDTVTVTTPDLTHPRIDVVYIDDAGNAQISTGTPAASPTASYPATTHLPVAEIYVKKDSDPSVTVSGAMAAYASSYAQAYLYEDVRPFFGINYDIAYTGAEYLDDLGDVTITSPVQGEVISYVGGQWTNKEWTLGGIGGGQPTLQVDGPLVTLSGVGGAYICTRSGEINRVWMYLADPGTAGATTIDVNLNSTTIFANPSQRPTLLYDDADQVVASPILSGVYVSPGDIIRVDIDAVATDCADMTVTTALDIMNDHPFSGGPHTGVLHLSDLEDGTVSGYVLVAMGNGLSGGPVYAPVSAGAIGTRSIGYSKIGGGVPKAPYRQGGSATNYATPGTTDYDITTENLITQFGSISIAGLTTSTVTFPQAFGNVPVVFTKEYNTQDNCQIMSLSASQVQLRNNVSGAAKTYYWVAIGPE